MRNLKYFVTALSIALFPILLVAQQHPCDLQFRECSFDPPEPTMPISIPCGAQDTYLIDGPYQEDVYACRGFDEECPGEGPCNIQTKSQAFVYFLDCPETGSSTFCVKKGTSPGAEVPTGTTCQGEFCDNGLDPVPDDLVPANNDANASQWKPWPRR